VKFVRFIIRALPWLLGIALLLAAASWLDKFLGTGRVLMGIALGLAAAAILFNLFVRYTGRIAQRAADDRRHRLKPAPFPEDPFASYDWTVRTLGGEPFSMEKIRREVVFLNFWSTTCVPCLTELPSIQRLHDRIASEGVVFMCVALDSEAERVREAVARNALNVPVFLLENDQIPTVFDSDYIPSTFMIDADGRVRYHHQGAALWDHPRVETFLRGLLMQDIVRQINRPGTPGGA